MSKKQRGGSVESIRQRDKKCWLCKHQVAKGDASRDHIQPRSDGGFNKSKNYRLAHRACNAARGSLPEEFVIVALKELEGFPTAEVVRQALSKAKIEYYNLSRPRERR